MLFVCLIVRLLGWEFVRIFFGGVWDEVEICGYCCMYVGVMFGCIIQGMKIVGLFNFVFLLDEIDKMVFDFCGDLFVVLFEVFDFE